MGEIRVTRASGKQTRSNATFKAAKIDAAINILETFIENDSPSNAETLAQVKFQARILENLLNKLRIL